MGDSEAGAEDRLEGWRAGGLEGWRLRLGSQACGLGDRRGVA
jgi:hypothetical protein